MNKWIIPFVVDDHIIKAYWLGKWRTLRYYGGNKPIPSKKIVDQAIATFRMNAGVIMVNAEVVPKWQLDWRENPTVMKSAYERRAS